LSGNRTPSRDSFENGERWLAAASSDPDRKNAVSIVLTDHGRDICLKTFQRESVKQILSCLDEDDRKQLMKSLIHLRERALKDRRVRNRPPFPSDDC
jgi:hypothetical protein